MRLSRQTLSTVTSTPLHRRSSHSMPIGPPQFQSHTELSSFSLSSTRSLGTTRSTREKPLTHNDILTVHPSQYMLHRPFTVNGLARSLSKELFSLDGSGALANRPITAPLAPDASPAGIRTIRHFVSNVDLPCSLPEQRPDYNFRPDNLKPEGFRFEQQASPTRKAATSTASSSLAALRDKRMKCSVHPGPGLGGSPRPIGRPRVNAVGGIVDGYEFMGYAARGMNIGREGSRRTMQDEKAEIAAQRITGPEPMYRKRTVPTYRGHSLREPLPSITHHAEALWTRAPTRYVSRRFGQIPGHVH